MTKLEILVAAQELIRDPARFSLACMAERDDGRAVAPNSRTVARWDAQGAIIKVSYTGDERDALWALEHAARRLFDRTTIAVSETLSHAAVMQMFDEAIRAEREKEGVR